MKTPYCLNFVSLLSIFTALFTWIHTVADPTLEASKLVAVENPPIVMNVFYKEVTPMRSVMFNFRPDVSPERQDAVLVQIETWDGISKTAHLKPDTKHADVRRMCYAYVDNNTDVEVLRERLSALPEIESAFIPAERRLL